MYKNPQEKEASNNREEEESDSFDEKTRASVASSRQSTDNSRAMNAIQQSIQKGPLAASLPPSSITSPVIARNNGATTMQAARSTASDQSVSISVNSEHASPPCASLPAGHATAEIQGQDLLDDVSSLSATDNDNAKSMRLLQQYFVSLAQSGTTRTIMEEKDLITSKISVSPTQAHQVY